LNQHIRELTDDEKVEMALAEAKRITESGGTVSFDKLTWKHGLAGKVNHIQLAEQFYGSRE